MYHFISYMLKHREIDEKSHRSTAAPLLFKVDQPVVALWLHDRLFLERFLMGRVRLPAIVKLIITRYLSSQIYGVFTG